MWATRDVSVETICGVSKARLRTGNETVTKLYAGTQLSAGATSELPAIRPADHSGCHAGGQGHDTGHSFLLAFLRAFPRAALIARYPFAAAAARSP
jgi:hypothetical protein